MKRALIVGLNDYPEMPLGGCTNDAEAMADMLRRNGNGTVNFDVLLTKTAREVTLSQLKSQVKRLFSAPADVALFFFAGHGTIVDGQAYLCTSDYTQDSPGLRMEDLMQYADEAASKIRNRIILLDCCFSGSASNRTIFSQTVSNALLSHGTTVLTASRENQVSQELDGHGVFTYLMLDALRGGAADILGRITPAGVYSHIDQSLGAWDQRPLFKSHVDSFLVMREMPSKVSLDTLKALPSLFPKPDSQYLLTPEHEHTNQDGSPRTDGDKTLQSEFLMLQSCNRAGLVIPIGAEHMYWAAMNSKSCQLTPLGKHYWRLAANDRL